MHCVQLIAADIVPRIIRFFLTSLDTASRCQVCSILYPYKHLSSSSITAGSLSPASPNPPGHEHQDERVQELTASLEEAAQQRATLEQEREEARAENAELMSNYSRLQSSVAELQARVQEQEGKAMLKAQQDAEIQALKKALSGKLKNSFSSSVLFVILAHIVFVYIFVFIFVYIFFLGTHCHISTSLHVYI